MGGFGWCEFEVLWVNVGVLCRDGVKWWCCGMSSERVKVWVVVCVGVLPMLWCVT